MTCVLPGPASIELGKRLAERLGVHAIPVETKSFPDGESYLRITDDIAGQKVAIVQSTYPPQNSHLVQLLQLLDAAQDLNASELIAVVPYLAYSRQDKRFRPGEAISVGTVVKLIEAAGTDSFLTVDIHTDQILDLFRIRAQNISAMPVIGEYFSGIELKEPCVFAPDEGALDRARTVALYLRSEYSFFEKERDRVTGRVKTDAKNLRIRGRDAIIVDDIISTGSTMVNATAMLHEQGARDIYVACTHPLLLAGAKERIMAAGAKEVIGTDCVESDVSRVSVASVIAESLRKTL